MSCPRMTTLSRAARSTSEPALRSDRLLRGWGGCRFSVQRRTQRRPRPRSPQTVGRWSSERPKTANITRRRPTGKVLLLRTGFHAIDRYRHRRPVLVLPRRRPQVDTQHLPPILRVSKPLAVERVLTHSRPWLPPRPLDRRILTMCPARAPITCGTRAKCPRIFSGHFSEQAIGTSWPIGPP